MLQFVTGFRGQTNSKSSNACPEDADDGLDLNAAIIVISTYFLSSNRAVNAIISRSCSTDLLHSRNLPENYSKF
jgi:hypothetical protein